mgnify:CR=1 FL=1
MNFYNDKYEIDSDVSSNAKQYQVKYATINKETGFMRAKSKDGQFDVK